MFLVSSQAPGRIPLLFKPPPPLCPLPTCRSLESFIWSSTTNSMSKRESSESGRLTLRITLMLLSYEPYSGLAAASTLQRGRGV